jgi:hypothetical protein
MPSDVLRSAQNHLPSNHPTRSFQLLAHNRTCQQPSQTTPDKNPPSHIEMQSHEKKNTKLFPRTSISSPPSTTPLPELSNHKHSMSSNNEHPHKKHMTSSLPQTQRLNIKAHPQLHFHILPNPHAFLTLNLAPSLTATLPQPPPHGHTLGTQPAVPTNPQLQKNPNKKKRVTTHTNTRPFPTLQTLKTPLQTLLQELENENRHT